MHFRKNIHGVPKSKLSELKKRYENVSVSSLVSDKCNGVKNDLPTTVSAGGSSNDIKDVEQLPQRNRRKPRNTRTAQQKKAIKEIDESVSQPTVIVEVQSPTPAWIKSVLDLKEKKGKNSEYLCEQTSENTVVVVDMESMGEVNSEEVSTFDNTSQESPMSPIIGKKKKRKNNKLTAQESQAMFKPIRMLSETTNWSQFDSVCFDKPKHSDGKQDESVDQISPTFSGLTMKHDAETSISEIDEVLLNGFCTEDLAADLGYQLLDVLFTGAEIDARQECAVSSEDFDHELSRQTSLVQAKQTQTDDVSDTTQPQPQAELNPQLERLKMIFPNCSLKGLAEVLEQTQGDVEWAADICLELEAQEPETVSEGGENDVMETELMEELEDKKESLSPHCHNSLSPPSSPIYINKFLEKDPPRLTLSKEFILRAHKKYGEEYGVGEFDFDSLPPELYQDWIPPERLVKTVYCAYLEHLGLKASPPPSVASTPVVNTNNMEKISNCSDDRLETEFEMPTSSSNQWKENDFRHIMQEEEVIEKIMTEKRKELTTDVASHLKFDRLRSQYPSIAEHVLMDMFISFQCNEEATHQYLKGQGHEPVQRPQEENEDLEEEYEFLNQPKSFLLDEKGKLNHLRDNLSRRKETLSSQLRQIVDKKMMGVSPFYSTELNDCDRRLQEVKEKLRKLRLAEQTHDTLDLHGFSVAEAIKSVRERLNCIHGSRKRVLTIFTGVGRHSQGAAKLRPAINQFLNQKSYRFREIRDGVFEVRL